MKRFLLNLFYFLGIPVIGLIGIYLITDPFKTLHTFDLNNCSTVNRDYLSTEIYLKNYKNQKYDSFIFGSSRGCGLNTYLWKSYLPTNSNQFLFQAWSETITGIYQKIRFIDQNKQKINNAIILIDIPSTFSSLQEPHDALTIKHYLISGKSKLYFQFYMFLAYLKPTEIYKSLSDFVVKPEQIHNFDTISNDWDSSNRINWSIPPVQHMKYNKSKFEKRPDHEVFSKQLLDKRFIDVLYKIKLILDKQHTNCKIIITPAYSQLHINKDDLRLLQFIFGTKNVYNYSGKNAITENKYNFMDLNHFDTNVGYQIINDICNGTCK